MTWLKRKEWGFTGMYLVIIEEQVSLFLRNICCGYSLELPQHVLSNEHQKHTLRKTFPI